MRPEWKGPFNRVEDVMKFLEAEDAPKPKLITRVPSRRNMDRSARRIEPERPPIGLPAWVNDPEPEPELSTESASDDVEDTLDNDMFSEALEAFFANIGDADIDNDIDDDSALPVDGGEVEASSETDDVAWLMLISENDISFAVAQNDVEKVKELLDQGSDPMEGGHWQDRSAFMMAVSNDRAEILQLFIDRGFEFDFPIWNKQTPLFFAVEKGMKRTPKVLLAAGADPLAPNTWGHTPFEEAMKGNDNDMKVFFHEHCPKDYLPRSYDMDKVLDKAAEFDGEQLLQILLERKLNIGSKQWFHESSLLQRIADKHKPEIVAIVLEEAVKQGCDLECGQYEKLVLRERDFSKAAMSYSKFNLSELQGSSFFEADLSHSSFFYTDLRGANLSAANLEGANLTLADLRGAMLWGANLKGACLDRTSLKGAYIKKEDIERAGLDPALFAEAYVQ